jgi:fumarylacetoacetase
MGSAYAVGYNGGIMSRLNATHAPGRRSWLDSANVPGCDFPIQNLPHGVVTTADGRVGGAVAIGDKALLLGRAIEAGLLVEAAAEAHAAAEPTLNRFMEMGRPAASRLRRALGDLLDVENADRAKLVTMDGLLSPLESVRPCLPAAIGGFTDFLCSYFHTSTARRGRAARPIPDAFRHLPIGYNSRASSVVPSGHPLVRPRGQGRDAQTGDVYFEPTRSMDFELEVGVFIGGTPNPIGQPMSMEEAEARLFGFVILNDWSARDIQHFENRLGPFLGKSLLTTISPWIVTAEAMAPFRAPCDVRQETDPPYPPHLDSTFNRQAGALRLELEARLSTSLQRAEGRKPAVISRTQMHQAAYWSFAQMLTHHASSGCNMRPGDLIGSGTLSGEPEETAATMLEITAGTAALELPGETRLWLEDGDEVILTGYARAPGHVPIGFGACSGQVHPAPPWPSSMTAESTEEVSI